MTGVARCLHTLLAKALPGLALASCLAFHLALSPQARSEESLAALRQAAEKGNAGKQYELARRYQFGRGVPEDDALAVQWLRRAAQGGNAHAQHDLGYRHERGEGVAKSAAEALKWYHAAAAQSHSGAQNNLGEMHLDGNGVAKDCGEAAKWFRLAADAEDARAQFHLGVLSATGCGVPQDDMEAVSWYRRAAQGWHDRAQLHLGFMYHAGRGVAKDTAQAALWFRRGEPEARPVSLALLGLELWRGSRGTDALPRDAVLAHFFLALAAGGNDPLARDSLDEVERRVNPAQRLESQRLLAEWQKLDTRRIDDWVFLLGTPDPRLSGEAEQRVKDAGTEALPALVAALRASTNGRHIFELCEAVRRLGPAARESAPALEALLARRPARDIYRPLIAVALARVDPERGKAAVPELERCSRDASFRSWVRMSCLIALDDVGSESVSTRVALLDDEEPDLRAMAAGGLGKAPAAQVRAPLQARLRDAALAVRVRAAASLLRAVPEANASAALPALVEGLCQGDTWDAQVAVSALEDLPREKTRPALTPLARRLETGETGCRTWAAVALGRLDPARARPALPLLRQALRGEDEALRRAAAWTLGAMGPAAREALADLEQAASRDPLLALPRDRVSRGPTRLEECRLVDVRLVAVGRVDDAATAYLLHERGSLWQVQQGHALEDAVVEAIEGESVRFREKAAATASPAAAAAAAAAQTRLTLFAQGAPSASAGDPQHTGQPLSIDLDAEVATLAELIAGFSGLNVILEAGSAGRVRVAARQMPWDAVFERALAAGGFGHRIDRAYVRIARRDALDHLLPLSGEPSGALVSFSFRNGDLRDLAHVFGDISGQPVELPPGDYEPVTIFARERPWDELLALILASRGLAHRVDGGRIRVEKAPGR